MWFDVRAKLAEIEGRPPATSATTATQAPAARPVSQVSQLSQRPRGRNRKPCPPLGPMGWIRTRTHISTACTFTGLQPMALWQALWAGAQRGLGGLKQGFARRGCWCMMGKRLLERLG